MSWVIRLLLMGIPAIGLAADDSRVTRLEQDVRTLQRDLQGLARQVDNLRLQTSRPAADGTVQAETPALATNPAWVDAAKWRRLRAGMTSLEVIGALGPPTSTRDTGGTRELLYALELGTTAFLAGSVKLHDDKVVEIGIPTLR